MTTPRITDTVFCLCVLGPLHASLNNNNKFCPPPSSCLLSLSLTPTKHSSTLHFFSQQTPKIPYNHPTSSASSPHQRVCQARHRAGRGPWNSCSSSRRYQLVQAHPPQGYPARGIFLIFLFSSHSVHLLLPEILLSRCQTYLSPPSRDSSHPCKNQCWRQPSHKSRV